MEEASQAAEEISDLSSVAGEESQQEGAQPAGILAQELDSDALLGVLDAHSRGLRQDLLAYFQQVKEGHARQRAGAVEAQRAEGAAALASKQGELNSALAAGEAQRARTARLTAALERAVYRLHKNEQLRKSWALLAKAWTAWREHTARQRRIARGIVRATLHHRLCLLRAWRSLAHTGHRERLKREHDATVQASQQQIWQEANAANLELSRRVAELEGVLAEEQAAKAKLEEDMKRAFMRGVCALNIEAMALMKNGGPQGGAATGFAGLSSQLQPAQQQQQPDLAGSSCPSQPIGYVQPPAAATSAEPWLIGTLGVQQAAAEHRPWPQPPSAKPVPLQGCLAPYFSSPGASAAQRELQAEQQPLLARPGSAHLASPGGAAVAVMQPKPPAEVPHPVIKVAPTLLLDLPGAKFPNQPLAEREYSPSRFTRPPVSVPSNLRSNVPADIAAAMAARPQTAAGPQPQVVRQVQSEPRRPATSAGGLSQRSQAAAKKGGGPVVLRGPQPGAASQQQQLTAQEAAAARRSMQQPGQQSKR